jgi:hypothetical protein
MAAVLSGDAGAAEQVAAIAGDVDRHADVVPLGQGNLGRLSLPASLMLAQTQDISWAEGDAAGHVGHAQLRGLGLVHRPAEELAFGWCSRALRFRQAWAEPMPPQVMP